MIDYIILGIIIVCLGLIILRSVKRKKAGKNVGCGSGCGQCSSSAYCHSQDNK